MEWDTRKYQPHTKGSTIVRIIWVSIIILVFDQITKMMVKGVSVPALNIHLEGVPLKSSRPIWGDLIRLTYIENPGMAFGIDIGGKLFFSVFTVIASIGIFLYLYKMRSEPYPFRFSLAMILGGACGNLIDRVFYGVIFGDAPLFYGKVVDFIDIDFFDVNIFGYYYLQRWPVFNIADASVSIGVIVLLFVHQSSAHPVPSSAQPVPDPGRSPSASDNHLTGPDSH